MRTGEHRYDDILEREHHVSMVHPQMPLSQRAAQFAPYAALTGYDAAILETARLTLERAELDENRKAELDAQLRRLRDALPEQPELTAVWFVPDERKEGGAYVAHTGRLRRIDEYRRVLQFTDGTEVPLDELFRLDDGPEEAFPAEALEEWPEDWSEDWSGS